MSKKTTIRRTPAKRGKSKSLVIDGHELRHSNIESWKVLARIEHPAIVGGMEISSESIKGSELPKTLDVLSQWVYVHACEDPSEPETLLDENREEFDKAVSRWGSKIPASMMLVILMKMGEEVAKATKDAVTPFQTDSAKK